MFALNLPTFDGKIKQSSQGQQIFDPYRQRYVALTPEEWVRQHFCHYLVTEKHYPASRLANEYRIQLNGRQRRCDTVVFDADLQPLVICEYKAPTVEITEKVFQQIMRYDWVLKARLLIVGNGLRHYCCLMDYEHGQSRFLEGIPDYAELMSAGR